jgi:hypothetical protein
MVKLWQRILQLLRLVVDLLSVGTEQKQTIDVSFFLLSSDELADIFGDSLEQ